jgi:hypothetical protein
MSGDVQKRRDLNTMVDVMTYLRDLNGRTTRSYISKGRGSRTSIGANQFAAPTFIASTLPAREAHYLREFLAETDSGKREKILDTVAPEMQRALSTRWAIKKARIAQSEGQDPGEIGEGGRLYTEEGLKEYDQAETKLDYGNWLRSKRDSRLLLQNRLRSS